MVIQVLVSTPSPAPTGHTRQGPRQPTPGRLGRPTRVQNRTHRRRLRDIVQKYEERVGTWDDPQSVPFPETIKDVVLRFGGLSTRPLAIGTGVRRAGPETPHDRGLAFFDK
jgi:hypothetical protein